MLSLVQQRGKIELSKGFIFIFFLVVCFFIPLLIIANVDNHFYTPNLLLSWLIILLSGTKLTLLCFRNEKRLLELTFWVFVYVWLGASALAQIVTNRYPWADVYSDDLVFKALLIVLIGLISYEVGLKMRKRKTDEINHRKELGSVNIPALVFFSIVCAGVSVAMVIKQGGFDVLFLSRLDRFIAGESAAGGSKMALLIFNNLQKVPIFVSVLLMLYVVREKAIPKYKLLFAMVFLLNLIINNPISNARLWFGTVALTLLFIFIRWNKATATKLIVGLLLLLLVVFPYSDLFRTSLSAEINVQKATDFYTTKGDYDVFQMVLNTVRYVDTFGHTYGKQVLGATFFWVPRTIWEDKPVGTGQHVATNLGYSFTNLSCPLWAEAFIDFGWIGVSVVFLILGRITKHLQELFIMNSNKRSLVEMVVPFLAAYQIFLLRGDLLNGVAYMSLFLGLMFMIFRLSRRREKVVSAKEGHTVAFISPKS